MLIAIVISAYGFLFILFLTDTIDTMVVLQERFILLRLALGISGMIAAVSIFYIWFKMLSHWRGHVFGSLKSRWAWLALLIVLNVLGGVLYYIINIEFGKAGDPI